MNFGMLVEQAEPAPRPEGALLLLGPVLGTAPATGAELQIVRELATPLSGQFAGLMHFHGGTSRAQVGVVVTPRSVHPDAKDLCGAVVHESEVSCGRFRAIARERLEDLTTIARFEYASGPVRGLLRIRGSLVDGWLLGDAPQAPELLIGLRRIAVPGGPEILPSALYLPIARKERPMRRLPSIGPVEATP